MGVSTALRVQFALEAIVCIAALVVGLAVIPRVTGLSRWWRMSLLAAVAIFLAAELGWQLAGFADRHATAPWLSVVAYFVGAFFFSTAMVLLIRAGRDHDSPARGGLTWRKVMTTVLDGLISALSFSQFIYLARPGAIDSAALPRSTNTTVVLAIAAVEMVVVMIAVLIAMWYPPYRLGRANYMLLAAAVITLVSSDRLLAYLRSVDMSSLDLWIGAGFIVAPLLIAWSLLELPPPRPPRPQNELPTNWPN